MREILFRGKRSDGEWVFGSLLKVTFDGTTYNLIFADNFLFVFGQATAMEHAAVIPATVGQFTGLTDKNGKKIFEGDIVRYETYEPYYNRGSVSVEAVEFVNGQFLPRPHIHYCEDEYYSEEYRNFEVIGNIHDNPELLEVSK